MKGMPYLSIKKSAKVSLDKMIMFLVFRHTEEYANRNQHTGSFRRTILSSQRDFEKHAVFSENEYLASLAALHERHSAAMAEAYSCASATKMLEMDTDYWQNEFPLHNPNENPDFAGRSGHNAWLNMPQPHSVNRNGDGIVPIRLVPALSSSHEHFRFLEKRLPVFLNDSFSVYDSCCVVSEFGVWKENAKPDYDSMKKIFETFRGQPLAVLVPEIEDDVLTISYRCQALGDSSAEPYYADFGSFDLSMLRGQELAKLIKYYNASLEEKNLQPDSEELEKALEIIDSIEQKEREGKLVARSLFFKLSSLPVPNDEIRAELEKRMEEVVSAIYICSAGMYADGYCMFEYGSLPSLPSSLHKIEGADLLWPYLRDYYIIMLNAALKQNLIRLSDAANIEEKLLHSYRRINEARRGYLLRSQPYMFAASMIERQDEEKDLETRVLEENIRFLHSIPVSDGEAIPQWNSRPAYNPAVDNNSMDNDSAEAETEGGQDQLDPGYVWDSFPRDSSSTSNKKKPARETEKREEWEDLPVWGNANGNDAYDFSYALPESTANDDSSGSYGANSMRDNPFINPLKLPDFINGFESGQSSFGQTSASSKNEEAPMEYNPFSTDIRPLYTPMPDYSGKKEKSAEKTEISAKKEESTQEKPKNSRKTAENRTNLSKNKEKDRKTARKTAVSAKKDEKTAEKMAISAKKEEKTEEKVKKTENNAKKADSAPVKTDIPLEEKTVENEPVLNINAKKTDDSVEKSEKKAEKTSEITQDNEKKEENPGGYLAISDSYNPGSTAHGNMRVITIKASSRPADTINTEEKKPIYGLPMSFVSRPAPEIPSVPKELNHGLLDKVMPGDIIRFGNYPYGKLSRMGKFRMWFKDRMPELQGGSEADVYPLEWVVLEKCADGSALLITRYAIDGGKYNEYDGPASWEDCSMRSWLNEDFIETAFTEEEQKLLLDSKTNNKNKTQFSYYGSKETVDKVFLLSIAEAEKYIRDRRKRVAYPTPYAACQIGREEENTGGCWWWLRTTGSSLNKAACVNAYGDIMPAGQKNVSLEGTVRAVLRADLAPLFGEMSKIVRKETSQEAAPVENNPFSQVEMPTINIGLPEEKAGTEEKKEKSQRLSSKTGKTRRRQSNSKTSDAGEAEK